MRQAILVNGVPASGKSTVTLRLVRYLNENGIVAVPFSIDTIKECLVDHIGAGDRDHNRMLGRASYHSIFATISAFPQGLVPVIDAWHGFQPPSVLQDHCAQANIKRVIEVWCNVTPAVASERYRARANERMAGHPPASYASELYDLASRARPPAMGPVVEINTEETIGEDDLSRVLDQIQSSKS